MDATRPWRLEGVVKPYAWGSPTAIPQLLGREPSGEPQAELWLGAHRDGPASLDGARLDDWVRSDPESVLGARVAREFDGELPFLLKLLAAAQPLSIQAHPDAQQARAGFARENAQGIALDARERCYRDPHPKPELICALTPFRALNRFREPDEIARRLEALDVVSLFALAEPLRASADREGLRAFFAAWMGEAPERRRALVAEAARAAAASPEPAHDLLCALAAQHPGDAGVLAPLFLNLVELAPGEAMFLPAGELHSYLSGTAIEIMASSDNVLRGGLTPKHVDVPELLRVLRFESGPVEVLSPQRVDDCELRYVTPAREFALSRLEIAVGRTFAAGEHGPEILLCVQGEAVVEGDGGEVRLAAGGSAFVPAAVEGYRVCGEAALFRATVGRG
jgi:mannose-6-phosphate isomerase